MRPYYEQDGITIYHADCRDVLPNLEAGSFDVCLTDPPYGIDFDYGDAHDDDPETYRAFLWPIIEQAERLIKPGGIMVIFQAAMYAPRWAEWFPRDWRLIALPKKWIQMRPTLLQWATDYALWWHVGAPNIKDAKAWQPTTARDWFVSQGAIISRDRIRRQHPCPRPIDTMTYLVSCLCPPDGLILDPFMGSGTTARAAIDTGRRCVGIEKAEPWCALAVNRLAQQVLPLAMVAD